MGPLISDVVYRALQIQLSNGWWNIIACIHNISVKHVSLRWLFIANAEKYLPCALLADTHFQPLTVIIVYLVYRIDLLVPYTVLFKRRRRFCWNMLFKQINLFICRAPHTKKCKRFGRLVLSLYVIFAIFCSSSRLDNRRIVMAFVDFMFVMLCDILSWQYLVTKRSSALR